jgi:hypothetical protein
MKINREELELKKLTGKFAHQCYEWDGMAIDETMPEFESCLCFKGSRSVWSGSVSTGTYREELTS